MGGKSSIGSGSGVDEEPPDGDTSTGTGTVELPAVVIASCVFDVTRPPQAPSSATVASSVTRVGDGICVQVNTRSDSDAAC